MSHSFYIDQKSAPSFSRIVDEMRGEPINFVEGYASPANDEWPKGLTYIYQEDKTCRAPEVEYSGGRFRIRIFAASSLDDYRLAVQLASAVSKISGADIETEEGGTFGLNEFLETHNSEWIADHCKRSLSIVLGSQTKSPESSLTLFGVGNSISIGPRFMAQVTTHPESAKEFFRRLRKLNRIHLELEDVYMCPILVTENAEGTKRARITPLGEGVDSLLCDKNTLVCLSGEQDLEEGGGKTDVNVPLSKLPDIMGDRAIWLSENLLLMPGMTGTEWAEFVEMARPFHVEDQFAYGYAPDADPFADESTPGSLSEEELVTLSYAPVVVFMLVAAADGDIDKKEMQAFQKELLKGLLTDSEVLSTAIIRAASEFETMVRKLITQEVSVQEKLIEIVSILNGRLPDDEAMKFKTSLVGIGESIASASGGFLGLFGSKIDKKERAALDMLKDLLSL